jgi:hypothetical protein
MMDCTISKARLSPATLDAVIRNRYWLLAVEAPWNLRLLLNLASDQSLIADTQGRYSGITVQDLGYGECCIAYPRFIRRQAFWTTGWLMGLPWICPLPSFGWHADRSWAAGASSAKAAARGGAPGDATAGSVERPRSYPSGLHIRTEAPELVV